MLFCRKAGVETSGQSGGHELTSGRIAKLWFSFFSVWLFIAEGLTSALPVSAGRKLNVLQVLQPLFFALLSFLFALFSNIEVLF